MANRGTGICLLPPCLCCFSHANHCLLSLSVGDLCICACMCVCHHPLLCSLPFKIWSILYNSVCFRLQKLRNIYWRTNEKSNNVV